MPRLTQILTTSTLSKESVVKFKRHYSNENQIIARTLRSEFLPWLAEPILDVGCGMGDIAAAAFGDRRTILLDRLDYSDFDTPALHTRITIDFFDYVPERDIPETLLFCHVLQFLDDDVFRLADQVTRIGAGRVLAVTNANDGALGEIIYWSRRQGIDANPELHLDGFPVGYACCASTSISTRLQASSFDELSRQVCFLLDIRPEVGKMHGLPDFLQRRLSRPEFDIRQEIRAYERS